MPECRPARAFQGFPFAYLSHVLMSVLTLVRYTGGNWRPQTSPQLCIASWTIETNSTSAVTRRSAGYLAIELEPNLWATFVDNLGSIDAGRPEVSIRLKLHVSRLYQTLSLLISSSDASWVFWNGFMALRSRPRRRAYRIARPKIAQALVSLYRLRGGRKLVDSRSTTLSSSWLYGIHWA